MYGVKVYVCSGEAVSFKSTQGPKQDSGREREKGRRSAAKDGWFLGMFCKCYGALGTHANARSIAAQKAMPGPRRRQAECASPFLAGNRSLMATFQNLTAICGTLLLSSESWLV